MTIFDYMCDVLHVECCADCSYFKNWECVYGYDHGDPGCLEKLGVTREDVINGVHPFERLQAELRATINQAKKQHPDRFT